MKQGVGALMLILSLLIMLPIPLGNTMPSVAIVIIAMGLAQRDGMFVITGLAVAALSVLGLIVLYWHIFVWVLGFLVTLAT
jgi:hypothetical protein